MNLKIVPNWRRFPRWISMWCFAVCASMAGTWLVLPEKYQAMVPPDWVLKGVIVFCVLGAVGRMFKQLDDALQSEAPKDPKA